MTPNSLGNRGRPIVVALLVAAWLMAGREVVAQGTGFIGAVELAPFVIGIRPVVSGGAVGGVRVDAQGIVDRAPQDAQGELERARRAALQVPVETVGSRSPSRKVSLARLEAEIARRRAAGLGASDEIRFLAGLQGVRYLFVYPELSDVVLAGPADAWRADAEGNAVGATDGRPLLVLDDLLVALRSAETTRREGISCSIEPSAEGLERLQSLAGNITATQPDQQMLASLEDQLGPQGIRVTGVPATSHFARVMVAADFRMKRLAMGFERPPIKGLPAYLQLVRPSSAGVQNMMPRWWLEPGYEALFTDADGLAWELRGRGVRALTEDDLLSADGSRRRSGRAGSAAQRWADNMTARYNELSQEAPIFGELANLMDLAVVAALVSRHDLLSRAGCPLSLLLDPGRVTVSEFTAPQAVSSRASFTRRGRYWLISISGGVRLNPWSQIESVEQNADLAETAQHAIPADSNHWWWD